MTLYTQWRAWIGPRWKAGNGDWVSWATGALATSLAPTTVQTTVSSAATSIVLAAATTWPSAGHAWIGPNGTGQGWEYIEYTGRTGSTLTGVTREAAALADHNLAHTAGAIARVLWPVTTDNGQLQITDEASPDHALVNWSGRIGGVLIPSAAIRNRHLIIIEKRHTPGAAWQIWRAGFLADPTIKDDAGRKSTWNARIMTCYDLAADTLLDGIRIGEMNLAKFASASAATPLADANKERHSGDYTIAQPDLSGSAAVDGDETTLYIAEKFVGTDPPNTTAAGWGADFASMIRVRPYPGEASGGRYFEWFAKSGTYNNASIYCKSGAGATVNFDGISCALGDRLIICEDEAIFKQQNPLSNPKATIEISAAFFNAIDTTSAGDALGIWRSPDGWSNCVSWGTYTNKPRKGAEMEFGPHWPNNPAPANPAKGQVIRYKYNAAAVSRTDHFLVDYGDLAAYRMGGGDDPHILITLPTMGLVNKAAITASVPGAAAVLAIWDGTANTTAGLPSSGTIQIGSEQITYSAKSTTGITVTARGANGSTAAAHPAGDIIQLIDTDGTATEGHAIKRIEWSRPSAVNVPKNFAIRRSNRATARIPSDNNHEDDYELLANVTNYASAAYTLNLSPSRRARHVIMEIGRMTIDFSRPRVNEIRVILDDATAPAGSYQPAGTVAAVLIRQLLINAGIPAAAISYTGSAPTLDGFSTERGQAGTIAADLADFTGQRIVIQPSGLIVIEANPTNGGQAAAATWTRATAYGIDQAARMGEPISQVTVNYQTSPTSPVAQEIYPAAAVVTTAETISETRLYADAAAAQAAARREYISRRYPTMYTVQLADGIDIAPGQMHRLQWDIDASTQPIDRYLIIASTDHEIAGNVWQTVISGQQIDREADY